MNQVSTIRLERTSQIARITFENAPANLVVPETIVRLHDIVVGLEKDPDIQVVVFASVVGQKYVNAGGGTGTTAAWSRTRWRSRTQNARC